MDFKASFPEETTSPFYSINANIKNKLHPYIKKPIDAILKLQNILLAESTSYTPDSHSHILKFCLGEHKVKQIILLTEGAVSVERINGKILIGTSLGPGIFGLEGSEFRTSLYRLKSAASAKMKSIPYERALEIISEHHAFPDFIICQRYYNDYIAYRNNILINHSAGEIVCALLIELSQYPYEERLRISAVNFIRDRSNLARSGIMRIFSELRQSACIDIRDGKLIKLDKVRLLTF